MKLEQQVCSLELAKKLEELGVKQESFFYWHHCFAYKTDDRIEQYKPEQSNDWEFYSAFTVAELGEMLPRKLEMMVWNLSHTRKNKETVYLSQTGRHCWYANDVDGGQADTEADARAKVLIYLLENKLI